MFFSDTVDHTPPSLAADLQSFPTVSKSWEGFLDACKWPFLKSRLLIGSIGNRDSVIHPSSGNSRKVDYLPQGAPEELNLVGGHVDLEGNLNHMENPQASLFERSENVARVPAISHPARFPIVENLSNEDLTGDDVQEVVPLNFLIAVRVHIVENSPLLRLICLETNRMTPL